MRTLLAVLLLCTAARADSVATVQDDVPGTGIVILKGDLRFPVGFFSSLPTDASVFFSFTLPLNVEILGANNPGDPVVMPNDPRGGIGQLDMGDRVGDVTDLPNYKISTADYLSFLNSHEGQLVFFRTPLTATSETLTLTTTVPVQAAVPLPAAVWGLPALLGLLALKRRRCV